MDFTIPSHYQNGVLNNDDLNFFYYDIGLESMQGRLILADWDEVVKEFECRVDIASCTDNIPNEDNMKDNTIRFSVSSFQNSDNGSLSSAFFRHLRNAFAHYRIRRVGDFFLICDKSEKGKNTMCGKINADLLKEFCFKFFEKCEDIIGIG